MKRDNDIELLAAVRLIRDEGLSVKEAAKRVGIDKGVIWRSFTYREYKRLKAEAEAPRNAAIYDEL